MSKNIVIFSDGTGQEGGNKHNTNVYKLFNMIETRTSRQVAFYDRGLGTGWRKFSGNVFGSGVSKNNIECYTFIFENYQVGDQIYLFGFSRGAYTVRSLSGFIHLFGILPESRPELIKKSYNIYEIKNKEERLIKVNEFLSKHHIIKCLIKFIGVWDTVKALGIPVKALNVLNPRKNTFHDHTMTENVKCGFHALSIDDERKIFLPTLWDERKKHPEQIIRQVWFPGVHTDVGGGYEQNGLSDITLRWMINNAKEHGLLLNIDHGISIKPNPNEFIHNSRKWFWGKWYWKKQRYLTDYIVKPVIHQSVLDRKIGKNNDLNNKYDPWILEEDYDIEPW